MAGITNTDVYTDLSSLQNQVSSSSSDITMLQSDVSTNTSDIAMNTSSISTLNSNLTTYQDSVGGSITTLDSAVSSINSPRYFWFTGPTLSGTESTSSNVYNPIPWGTVTHGDSSNLDSAGTWTCPAAGLWQFNFSIYITSYSGYANWDLFQNSTHVAVFENPTSTGEYTSMNCSISIPAKDGDTFYWAFAFTNDSSPPSISSSLGCFWQGILVAPSYTPS